MQEIFGSENLENGTFKAGSYHTLKFYYLERGSGPSNLSLKYNLVDIPASTMTKVDQLGKGVQGAEFKLYQTDAAYENEKLIGSGVTDATGSFTFTDANTVPINFMNLNASGISHYVLKETKTPEGYRKSPDARLKYVTNADKSIGFLLSDNYWESGVYARPEQVVTIAGGTVKEYGNGREIEVGDGNVFAVILKRDRSVDDMNACWHAVSGNSVAGWTVSKNAITSTTQLADVQKVYFEKNEDGKYVADLKELPGDPEQYYSMVSKENQDAGNFDYTVAFYAYDGKSNISRLDTSTQYFQRQSAANLHVTDIKNMLHVQKVDDAGTPVNGVTFNFYRSNQMIEADGKLAPRAGEDPAFTGKTQDNRNNNDATIKMDGMLSLGPLSPGTYYLVEDADKAPKGYIPNDAVVRVIVDDEGVHADAGVEGDGVVTLGGIGSLVDSMSQFGVKDDIDMTLYRVIATKATSTASDADGDGAYALDAWKPGTDTVTMENRPGSAYLEYVPVDSGIKAPAFTVDTGYVRAMVSQAKKPDTSDLGLANWTDLSKVANKNLSALFTGTNIVRITNERTASVAVRKEVAVPEGFELSKDAKVRDFTLTFTFGDLGTLPADTAFDAATFAVDENGAEHQAGNDYTIKSGDTHTLKHGETIKVYGLPNGASYKVEESPDTLYPQTQPADGGAIAGEVVAGETQTGTFVNTYTPTPATVDEKAFSYEKHFNLMKAVKQADGTYKEEMQELDGAWEKFSPADATFTMLLAEVKEGADATECPFPDGATTSEKDGSTFMTKSVMRTSNSGGASGSFGSITFDRPGTYTYLITEDLSGTLVDGITYSRANYRVIVTVKDKEGKLEASVAKFQTFGEAGVELDTPLSLDAAKPVTFNNSAAYDSITLGPNAYKQLVDTTDGRALAAGEFTFGAVPITEGAPIPTDQNGNPLPTDTDVNGTQYYKSTNDTLGYIAFGTATFTQEHVKTGDSAAYVYKLFEVIPSDAVNASVDGGKKSYAEADEVQRAQAGWTKDGVTYDSSVYYARVTVKIDDNSTDNVNHVTAAISYHESPEPDAAVIIGNSVTFKNVYDPVDAVLAGDARIKGQKTLKGRDALEGEAFTFELTAFDDFTKQALKSDALVFGSDKTATELTAQAKGAKNGEPCGFAFDADMTFSKVGTYRFAIKEMVPGDPAANMTYDPTTAEAVVTITDAGGKLKAEVSYINPQAPSIVDQAVFTNVYHAEGALAEGIKVSKVLTGRAMKAGEFSATVVGIDNTAGNTTDDDANARLPKADTEISFPKASAGSPVSKKILGDILFTQEDAGKTFSYIVAEDVPAEGIDTAGVSYDRSQYRVDLAVTDTGTGKLSVTPTVTKIVDRDGKPLAGLGTVPAVSFENRYEPAQTVIEDTAGALPLTKKLSGRGWLDTDKFEFSLTAKSLNGKTDADSLTKIPMPKDARAVVTKDSAPHYDSTTGAVLDAAIKDFGFKGITYTQAGTYVYEVREVIPDDATNPDVPGKTYGLAGADERAKAGWTRGGVTYDSAMVATVTCEVKDNLTGQLYVEASCEPAAVPTFTNTYTPGAVEMDPAAAGFSFTKVLKGKAWDGDEFAFTLKGADGAPMPEADPDAGVTANGDGTLTKTVSAAMRKADGFDAADFGFGPIRFERAGVYAYTVREVVPEGEAANPGIAYDGHAAKVKVTVTDDGSGNLAATATVEEGTFTNSYATGAVDFDAAAGLQIVKNMTGKAIAKDAFSFTVEGMDDESAAKLNGGHKLTVGTAGAPLVGNTATETLSVATKLSFAQEDVGKTYRYTVFEADGGKIIDGVTYDGAKHELAFAVTDGGSGVLEVAVSLDGEKVATYTGAASGARVADPVTVTFNNSYDAGSVDVGGDGAAAIKAHKTLTGRPLEADEFSFSVVNTLDDAAEPVTRGTNDAQGDIAFEPIAYTVEKLNGDVAAGLAAYADGVYTYTYTVSEDISSLPAGVTPVAASFTVKVLVTDSGTGSLDAQVVYPEGSDGSLEFRNAYGTGVGGSAELAVGGTKVLKVEGGETAPDIAGKYTFTLTGSKDAPMPEGAKDGVKTAVNDASGSVDLGTISYTMESVFGSGSGERTKTFDYTVTESGEVPGVVNDPVSSRGFTVTVTDNGDGTLSAVSSEKPGAQFAFTNTYAVEPTPSSPTSAGLTITKTLSGRDMLAGEFAFQLVDAAGKVVSTGTNDVEGKVELPAVTFTEPGDFAYTLREETGDAAGVTYDNRAYSLRAHVADNGDGTLAVTWTYGSDDAKELKAEFKNEYAVAPRTITFNAAKVLTGRGLREGEFSFQLYDGAGTLLQTVKNGAPVEGGYAPVVFDAVTIDRAGAYDFRIVEVAGDAEGIEYDKTEFTYHVVASDLDEKGNHTGKLEFEITEGETGAPVFRNTFSGTDGPGGGDTPGGTGTTPGTGSGGGSLVATGDDSMFAIMGVGAAGLVAVVAGIVVAKRRNRR
ncbi:Spy0128 family protein [Collinsella phocaeensis]|uniref:Spy0128 family protein n=1 Tax=Collinsella phocaeensis TaxID=1871016 RepID=UPI000931CE8B|nr:FctA domain-containing protein [Collinsella phocaeensis]